MKRKKCIVVMGVSGAGKSTIGLELAKALSYPFLDADDFHPKENVMKMSRGMPLDDDDRWPWLASIAEYIKNTHRDSFVLACSALKKSYREMLSQSIDCQFIFLEISKEEAINRLNTRKNHFMKSNLVQSQFDSLELSTELTIIKANQAKGKMLDEILGHLDKI